MKKLIAFILTMLMVVSVCSCGKKEITGDSETICNEVEVSSLVDSEEDDYYEKGTLTNKEEQMRKATLQYPSQNDIWKYNVYDCYIEITGYIGDSVDKLIIPDEIDSLPVYVYAPELSVSKIGDTTLKDTVVTVELPKDLLIIGDSAFSNFANLKFIDFPSNLIEIEKNAFAACTSLENVEFPETLKEIGDGVFNGCSSLRTVRLPKSVQKIGSMSFDNTNESEERNSMGYIIYKGVDVTVYNPQMEFSGYNCFSIIRGYAGSTAAQIAAEGNIEFEIIKE